MKRRPQAALHSMAVGFYALIAVILLHPLWVYNGTYVAGYDYFNYNWNFWWIRNAWANGLNIYQNDFVMFPVISNYGYHALTAFWYPSWALLEPLLGTLTTVNVIITLVCILNGYLLFVWLRSERVAVPLALLGGVLLQTLPITRYWYYNTHLNLMDWFWIPTLLLMWKGIGYQVSGIRFRASAEYRVPGAKSVSMARGLFLSAVMGVALWGLLLTDLQFPIFALFVVAPYGLLTAAQTAFPRLVHKQTVAFDFGATARLALCGVVAIGVGVVLMWFAGPLPYIARFHGTLVPGPVEERPGIAFPVGFLNMAEQWWQWDQPSTGAFMTLALLISVVIGLVLQVQHKQRNWRAWFWLLVALPPFVFAMGPHLTIGGARFPLPYVWLYDLTDGNFRMPWRLAPAGVIAGVTFIGLLWTPMLRRWQSRDLQAIATSTPPASPLPVLVGSSVILLAAFGAVRVFETGPIQPILPNYGIYETMGREPYEYVVLQAPTGMGTGEVLLGNARAIQYQWYGIVHEKRMINGFISRAPIDDFFYVDTGDALLSWLGQRRLLEPDTVESQLRERIFEYPLGYIVLHTDDIARASQSATEEIVGFFNQHDDLLCAPSTEGMAVIYRTRWHPEGCERRTPREISDGIYEIDIGNVEDVRFLGWGWHYAEPVGGTDWRWTGAYPQLAGIDDTTARRWREAEIFVDIPPGSYRFSVLAQSFQERTALRVFVGDVEVDTDWVVRPDVLAPLSVDIPSAMIGDGEHLPLRLVYERATVPAEIGVGTDTRRLAIAVDLITLERLPESAP
ncbi:MAG: hypothetical protein SF123_02860 [Chloroflexota bacterium]|nr:hypothetical protein [Chloroflexota bacterium]